MKNNNLTQQTVSGVIWKFAERIGAQVVTLIVSIILARILLPEDYGVVAIVTIFITICDVFVSSGFGSALIQKKNADDIDFSSVFYASIVISLALYAIVFFAAPLISSFYDNELLTSVLRVMGIRVPVAAINSVQQAYVSRKMEFKKFFFATLVGTIVSGAVGIWMAYNGYGIWSLVAQYLINVVMGTLVLGIVIKWLPKPAFSFKRLGALLSYGWKLLLSGLLDTGYNELRSLVIGKKYTSSDLAYFDQGKKYPSFVAVNLSSSFNTVLFSAMSKVQNDREKVKQATRKSISVSSYLLMPVMMGLACVAEPFVKVVLTDKWLPMVPYLQIMCFVYAFYPIHSANLEAIKAVGRSDLFLILEIIKKAVGIIVLVISMRFGVFWIAASMMITTITSSFINAFPNKKLLNYSYWEQIKDLLPALGLSVMMGVPVYLMSYIPLAPVVVLVLQILAGIIIYVVASVLFKVESFYFILNFVKKLFKKKNKTEFVFEKDKDRIYKFLTVVNKDFPVALSEKVNLQEYAEKLSKKATVICIEQNDRIVSMVAGYTENNEGGLGYISVLATLPTQRGKGYAEKLLIEFIKQSATVGVTGIHLYAVESNDKAVKLYTKLGFKKYIIEDEKRPDDLHLIKYFKEN